MLADNSHHLAAATQRRHDDAHQRAQEAIRVAAMRGEAVTASTLASRAGVSRAFLYAHPDLIDAIRELRSSGRRADTAPTRQRATETSLLRRIEVLHKRNKELRSENQDLRRRLEIAHGELRVRAEWA